MRIRGIERMALQMAPVVVFIVMVALYDHNKHTAAPYMHVIGVVLKIDLSESGSGASVCAATLLQSVGSSEVNSH